MTDPDPQRAAQPTRPPSDARRSTSLVPRWLAALVLIVVLAAGALSAWLVVTGSLERAAPRPPPAAQSGSPER